MSLDVPKSPPNALIHSHVLYSGFVPILEGSHAENGDRHKRPLKSEQSFEISDHESYFSIVTIPRLSIETAPVNKSFFFYAEIHICDLGGLDADSNWRTRQQVYLAIFGCV
jgi:hypothetical protein